MMPSTHALVSALGAHEALLQSSHPSFSQSGEDLIVNLLLHNEKEKGVFVDVGAYHPFRFSNTFMLYLAGWRGVNVDANAEAVELFKMVRPEDVSLRALVSDRIEELEFCRYAEGAYNTANRGSIEELAKRDNPMTKVVGVDRLTTVTLNQIFDQYVGTKKFDFLNIDVEGLDERIFVTIDFNRYRPKVIAIEMDIANWTREPVRGFLESKRYRVNSQCYHTTILERID